MIPTEVMYVLGFFGLIIVLGVSCGIVLVMYMIADLFKKDKKEEQTENTKETNKETKRYN